MADLPDKVVEALGRAVLGVEEDDSLSELEFDRRCIDAMLATGHVQAFTPAVLLHVVTVLESKVFSYHENCGDGCPHCEFLRQARAALDAMEGDGK